MKLLSVLLILLIATPSFAEDFDPFPQNRGTIYDYGDDIPDVCFFPIDKARWNGYDVKTSNWSQLTDYQKIKFIEEGAEAIERNEGVKVDIGDGWGVLVAINGGVATLPKDFNAHMIKFLRDLLMMKEQRGAIC